MQNPDRSLYAAHTDGLVLGLGDTEETAISDATIWGGVSEELLDICRIDPDAADYVRHGGDCRGLNLGEDDIFRLQPSYAAIPMRHSRA
jgi:hypothetical protein